jgi:hypothetical protein
MITSMCICPAQQPRIELLADWTHYPPVVGFEPTRPTYLHLRKPVIWPGWLVRGTAAVGNIREHPCRSGPAYA